jgi:flagellar assembly protein FliH
MSKVIPKEQLTAYQRWELAAFDEAAEPANTPLATPSPENQNEAASADEKVVLPTAEDIERLHQEAWQEGYQLGMEEGRKAGMAAGQETIDEQLTTLQTLMTALECGQLKQDQAVAREVLELALVVARQVLRTALEVKPELILDAISEALKTLPSLNGHHKIVTHPDNAQLIRDWLAREHGHLAWKVMEDAQMDIGSFRFEGAYNELDGSIQARWQELTRCLGADTTWLS